MQKRIFYSIWLISLAVLLTAVTVIFSVLYAQFTEEQFQQLRNESQLVMQGVTLNKEAYFEGLQTTDFRITWITADGTILYDNAADTSGMENHLERDEVQEALRTGYGESRRYSSTLSANQLYVARLLKDGTILRLSITQTAVRTLFGRFILPAAAIMAAVLILSVFIASNISDHIVRPLNEMDLDEPLRNTDEEVYAEVRPLLEKLDTQQRQIQKDREELEKTSLIRQEFTANASHELKTPLHVISGYAELLESDIVKDDDIGKFAGKIRHEAQRMSKLVEDIIDLSSLDGGVGMQFEETDLYRIARNAAESLELQARDADITLKLTGSSSVMMGVPHVLYSIVYNLCDNAIKYSEPGSAVEISCTKTDDRVRLSVKDNGIGIPKEDLDRIFERFYRVDKSHSKEVGGTGLGLSIVKHAAKIHQAEINVSSEPGKGSEFVIVFPAERAAYKNFT